MCARLARIEGCYGVGAKDVIGIIAVREKCVCVLRIESNGRP